MYFWGNVIEFEIFITVVVIRFQNPFILVIIARSLITPEDVVIFLGHSFLFELHLEVCPLLRYSGQGKKRTVEHFRKDISEGNCKPIILLRETADNLKKT